MKGDIHMSDQRTGERDDAEFVDDGSLPDVPDAGDDSMPITSPNPIDFSTSGIAAAGAAGMGTFNDDNDRGLFERSVDAFEEADIDSPMLGASAATESQRRRVRIYG
jgi:hypothetical protein